MIRPRYILLYLVAMRVSCYENVCPQLPLGHGQRVGVSPRHDLMSMYQSYTELPYLHHLRLWERR